MRRPALTDPLTLPSGLVLANRLGRAAMTEGLAGRRNDPNERHERLYAAQDLTPALSSMAWRQQIPVYSGGRQVGRATSGTWSPGLKKNIALACVEARLGQCQGPVANPLNGLLSHAASIAAQVLFCTCKLRAGGVAPQTAEGPVIEVVDGGRDEFRGQTGGAGQELRTKRGLELPLGALDAAVVGRIVRRRE